MRFINWEYIMKVRLLECFTSEISKLKFSAVCEH